MKLSKLNLFIICRNSTLSDDCLSETIIKVPEIKTNSNIRFGRSIPESNVDYEEEKSLNNDINHFLNGLYSTRNVFLENEVIKAINKSE
ncbi:hypothetical protein CWI38_1197p0010 [Hamiltosporidium tvaerminnensis]|uniref:Uncharacterized protein n=1 Tax=Hamiltosporidium tvaerminnensis TaxID=1176355 RepID=A0A4Q9KT93_9MICR|nr:hypothetical protein CWI37_2446p0010 [Hamiltosporidium tvaerminnensis]TBU10483.1 hypothetical protein CWI38_1731p0020 [Hamiltosporidium tvaerminnensis]TBU11455.1 hypothetical protein CWI38_1197p0010 [Hamiltosporidium tvaerminnensis]